MDETLRRQFSRGNHHNAIRIHIIFLKFSTRFVKFQPPALSLAFAT